MNNKANSIALIFLLVILGIAVPLLFIWGNTRVVPVQLDATILDAAIQ